MATPSRKVRGRETEKLLARYYQSRGWPYAEAVASSIKGRDITGMPGLAPEVKARAGLDPAAWLRQAERNSNGEELPFVVFRPNGMGEASIGSWCALLRLDQLTDLLRAAGYGDPLLPGTE